MSAVEPKFARDKPKSLEGTENIRVMLEKHEALEKSFDEAYPCLLRKYPDRWVAWSKDGVVKVSDSHRGILQKTRARELTAQDMVVQYIESEPAAYIL